MKFKVGVHKVFLKYSQFFFNIYCLGCRHTITVELSSYDRDHIALKA